MTPLFSFLFKALLLVLVFYFIIKNLKYLALIAAIIFLIVALQGYLGISILNI